jgi:hypothetical protein
VKRALAATWIVAAIAAADARADPFLTLDPASDRSQARLDTAYEAWRPDQGGNIPVAWVVALDLDAEYLTRRGYGGYVAIPVTIDTQDAPAAPVRTTLGNLEAGGVLVRRPAEGLAIVVHGGVALPTASQEDASALFAQAGAFPRLGDFVRRYAYNTWGRLGASVLVRRGVFEARVDLGGDLSLRETPGIWRGLDLTGVLHAGLGVGVDAGPVTAAVEAVTDHFLWPWSRANDTDESTAALSLSSLIGRAVPGVALVLPLQFAHEPSFEYAIVASVRVLR